MIGDRIKHTLNVTFTQHVTGSLNQRKGTQTIMKK